MELNLDIQYINNLDKYTGKNIQLKSIGNGIEIYYDFEIQYRLIAKSLNDYEFQTIERGKVIRSIEFHSELEMKRNLALIVKGIFDNRIDYSVSDVFEELSEENLKELTILMNTHVEEDYYSIDNPERWRINLEPTNQNGKFNLYILLSSNVKVYIESDIGTKRAFKRFYNEAIYFKENMKRINLYQEIFDDRLSYDEIDQLLHY